MQFQGTLEAIFITPTKAALVQSLAEVEATTNGGLRGDRYDQSATACSRETVGK